MIICCGEALIDMLPRSLPTGEDVFQPVPGGALFNTAVALGRLGVDTAFLSGLSNDMFGTQLASHLQVSNVDIGYAIRTDHPTTLAFVAFEDGVAHYSFFDENSAGRLLHASQLPDIPQGVQALHFGGISLIAEPCGSAYEALACRQAGNSVISLDPNIRPGFVDDEPAYRDRLARLMAVSDIIKVSEEDFAWLEPERSFSSVCKEWISGGASLVVLTRGGDGCQAHTASFDVEIEAERVEVVDSVGAGDTFNAGLLASLAETGFLSADRLAGLDDITLVNALRFAAKVAGHTVGQTGANPPWKSQIHS